MPDVDELVEWARSLPEHQCDTINYCSICGRTARGWVGTGMDVMVAMGVVRSPFNLYGYDPAVQRAD